MKKSSKSPAPNSLVRCAIYTRVSTDDQTRGEYNSLESQRDICEHAIAVHLHEGRKTTLYFDDPGFSGKNLDRPGIQALMQEIEAGQIESVAYKIDRISCRFRVKDSLQPLVPRIPRTACEESAVGANSCWLPEAFPGNSKSS